MLRGLASIRVFTDGKRKSKTPVVTCTLAMTHAGLLPSAKSKASAFPSSFRELSLRTTTIHFSGLNTEPAPLLHPAPDSRCRVYLWISLLARWLTFRQAGLSFVPITCWVTLSNFTSLWSLPMIRASLGARIRLVGRSLFQRLQELVAASYVLTIQAFQ